MRFSLWLAVRLIRKQKLRTGAVFCGQLFSLCLLEAFGSFGYEFWGQVHPGGGEETAFDMTRWILVLLAAVLVLVVVSCSAVLLHNLFALTVYQRWRSLSRLVMLGARWRTMAAVTVAEAVFLYCPAALLGGLITLALQRKMGLSYRMPLWMWGGIGLFVLLLSLLCSFRPLWAAMAQNRENFRESGFRRGRPKEGGFCRRQGKGARQAPKAIRPVNFVSYMARRYYRANRGHYMRITLTILSSIVLYVPASYLINTNLSMHQEGLTDRYGIRYGLCPGDYGEVKDALLEYGRLRGSGLCKGAVVTVSMPGTAAISREGISRELLAVLKEAGWTESPELLADCTVCFLEDDAYREYLGSSGGGAYCPAVLVNRYINRASWSPGEIQPQPEVPALEEGADPASVEIYYEYDEEWQPDRTKKVVPDVVREEVPEGVDDTGSLLLILPLRAMEGFLGDRIHYEGIQVQGKFEEQDPETFGKLEQALGGGALGELRYTRKIIQEWYDSMGGIHLAMGAICVLLFSISVLNIFSMLLFQYLERRRGLAVLWSLGQSHGGLLRILIAENLRSLWRALALGIPLSLGICYWLYRIFRRVWAVAFLPPLRQLLLIAATALGITAAAVFLDYVLMRHQDFLEGARRDV